MDQSVTDLSLQRALYKIRKLRGERSCVIRNVNGQGHNRSKIENYAAIEESMKTLSNQKLQLRRLVKKKPFENLEFVSSLLY